MDQHRERDISESRKATEADQQQPSREGLREFSAERTERWLSSHTEQQQHRQSPFETWTDTGSTLPSTTSTSDRSYGRLVRPHAAEDRNRSANDVPSSSRYSAVSSKDKQICFHY